MCLRIWSWVQPTNVGEPKGRKEKKAGWMRLTVGLRCWVVGGCGILAVGWKQFWSHSILWTQPETFNFTPCPPLVHRMRFLPSFNSSSEYVCLVKEVKVRGHTQFNNLTANIFQNLTAAKCINGVTLHISHHINETSTTCRSSSENLRKVATKVYKYLLELLPL